MKTTDNAKFPNGWVIKTYKHMNIPRSDFEDTETVFNVIADKYDENNEHHYRDITYGTYDRIQMLPVDSFSDFIKEFNEAYNWYGTTQSILLFPLEKDNAKRSFMWGKGKDRDRILLRSDSGSEGKIPDGFFGTSFCYISDEARNLIGNYDELLAHCNKVVTELVNEYNKLISKNNEEKIHGEITVELFGSLSSAELIIIWSAKQYTDILYLMDCIRDFGIKDDRPGMDEVNYSLFRTTYTMVSFPDVVKHDSDSDYPFKEVRGMAHIQFVMQDGMGESSIADFLAFMKICLRNSSRLIKEDPNVEIKFSLNRCAGEYDLVGFIESKYIPRLFINPENWYGHDGKIDPDNPNTYFCSIHHPKYNKYVLYTLTMLGYRESDLPDFAKGQEREGGDEWSASRRAIMYRNLSDVTDNYGALNSHRSVLIKSIEDEHKEKFGTLIKLINQNIPATSNMITQLNQLFSDYVQCCSSCADYIWIEDYNELFLRVLLEIRNTVRRISVWKNYEISGADSDEIKQKWEDDRERLKIIKGLINSLHQHTSHISSSNKLFFREQKMHFGYTAQHDLVIHAYYDIIKRLINYIYSNTDKTVQSQLYPLVYFTQDDRITSNIYSEEPEMDFLKSNKSSSTVSIPSRIMVIHIPIDGMDNLMHYLPMLIHEVYHYAAPRNRKLRNQILAQVVTLQVLRYGIGEIFTEQKNVFFESDRNKGLLIKAVDELKELIDPVLYKVISEKSDAIYAGIVEDFNEKKKDYNNQITDEMYLRCWFVSWIKHWVNDSNSVEKGLSCDDKDQLIYRNYSDLFHKVAVVIAAELEKRIAGLGVTVADTGKMEYEAQYYNMLVSMHAMIEKAIKELSDDSVCADDNFFQMLAQKSRGYVNDGKEVESLLDQFDEIFPDMAMVVNTRMPASAYMLQIALDLDKQLYNGKGSEMDQIRFSSVIDYLLQKEITGDKKIEAVFEEELNTFSKMYTASYTIASRTDAEKNKGKTENRASHWCDVFSHMFRARFASRGVLPFEFIYKYTDSLINDMEGCLDLKDVKMKAEREELFVIPYQKYLEILKDSALDRQKSELFKLSIDLIQKFQNYSTLKKINKDFLEKTPGSEMTEADTAVRDGIIELNNYESLIITPDSFFTAIRHTLLNLYNYRDEENISEATGMWFRGIANIGYPILPSGLVHYAEDAARICKGFPDNTKDLCSYAKVQLYNYESFRYSAEGNYSGIDPANYYLTINYLALMQHYEQHTNLVDWSEDYFGSSYFALEYEINANDLYEYQRSDSKYYKEEDNDAVMCILDPLRFNKACEQIEEELKIMREDVDGHDVRIDVPNLSILENENLYPECYDFYNIDQSKDIIERFDVKDPSFKDKKITLKYLAEHEPEFVQKRIKLPRAIYVAKLNDRIRAQSGLFIMYNLGSVPVAWKGDKVAVDKANTNLFHYQSLESIQEYYLTLPDTNPFLIKLRIPKRIKKELGRILYKCGISKEKIYPELHHYRHR